MQTETLTVLIVYNPNGCYTDRTVKSFATQITQYKRYLISTATGNGICAHVPTWVDEKQVNS